MKYHFVNRNPSSIAHNAKAKSDHQEAIDANKTLLTDEPLLRDAYPSLWRVIGRKLRYLVQFHAYARTKFISYPSQREDGSYPFFGSCRYLAKTFKGSYNTWNRNLNIFAALGLITKRPATSLGRHTARRTNRYKKRLARTMANRFGMDKPEIKRMGEKYERKLKEIGFYSIPPYDRTTLAKADDVAKTLLDNGFRTNGFSKTYLIQTLGKDAAQTIFPDRRTVTDYSEYVAEEIEDQILREIDKKGYTTKQEIINGTAINLARVHRGEYGFMRGDRKAIIAREFDRSHIGRRELLTLFHRVAVYQLVVHARTGEPRNPQAKAYYDKHLGDQAALPSRQRDRKVVKKALLSLMRQQAIRIYKLMRAQKLAAKAEGIPQPEKTVGAA